VMACTLFRVYLTFFELHFRQFSTDFEHETSKLVNRLSSLLEILQALCILRLWNAHLVFQKVFKLCVFFFCGTRILSFRKSSSFCVFFFCVETRILPFSKSSSFFVFFFCDFSREVYFHSFYCMRFLICSYALASGDLFH
jgi:hypothetical protein